MVFFELFSNYPDIVYVSAGQPLFVEGEAARCMYVLTQGSAEVMLQGRPVEVMQAGSIAGEMSLVSPAPHSATVLAVSDCQFVAIDEKRFLYLVQQTPHFATKVMQVMADRLRRADQLLADAARR